MTYTIHIHTTTIILHLKNLKYWRQQIISAYKNIGAGKIHKNIGAGKIYKNIGADKYVGVDKLLASTKHWRMEN
jgi:hypothetical protein